MQPTESTWLDDALGRLAADGAAFPRTPDLESRVRSRIAGRESGQRPPRGLSGARRGAWALRAAVAATALVAAAAIGAAASNDARDAIADFLGLGVAGERIEVIPRPLESNATPLPSIEGVAEDTTLEEAAALLGFEPAVPPRTTVERVLLLRLFGLEGVVLRTPGYDLWQFVNDGGVFLGKGTYGSEAVEVIEFEGQTAYWVTGGPRVLTVRGDDGAEVTGTHVVTTGHALIFFRGGVTYRIEGDLAKEEALAVAESLE